MSALAPPDPKRCQNEITPAHGFMMLGPRPRPERCPNKPVVIVRETKPGHDGKLGSMSLCQSCREIFWREKGHANGYAEKLCPVDNQRETKIKICPKCFRAAETTESCCPGCAFLFKPRAKRKTSKGKKP